MRAALVIFAVQQLCAGAGTYRWELPKGFPVPRVPLDNPMSIEKVKLGRFLFYDKRLSANGTMSCATCHRQELAFTDGRALPAGVTGQLHPRSAQSIVNVAYGAALTWSNPGLHHLEEQVLIPMLSDRPTELGLRGHEAATLAAFHSDEVYRSLFPRAFPKEAGPFTIRNVAKALACFVRTIISGRSSYDRFLHDDQPDAISESAKRGELLFFSDGTAGCFRCHSGFNFSDSAFHNTALYNPYPERNLGIFEHTHRPTDLGKFKTPSLRNVAITAPYMHDGSVKTLDAVLDHYSAGGRASTNPNRDNLIRGFVLTPQNRIDLIAFLESLTDTDLLRDPRLSDPWQH
jgi:cytochrome c peroxidase